jgi:putative Mg2+ transporter-C (MgtC) family protein
MDAIGSFLSQTSVDLPVTLFRLLVAFVLGGLIGLERERKGQSAGLRTHILICLGATLLTLLSIYIPQTHRNFQGGDPGRIAAQVVTGIGFLGGGAIFRLGASVRGLTTAASIWIVAGIGMTVGAGMYAAALIASVLVLFTLLVLGRFERRLFPGKSLRSLEIVMSGEGVDTDAVLPVLGRYGIDVKSIDVSQHFDEKTVRLRLTVQMPEEIDVTALYGTMGKIRGITKINLDQKI